MTKGWSMSAKCRLCCKSLFASLVTKFPSCRRDFQINIWGIPSAGDELTGDFGNELEAISIGDCGLFRLLARILSHGILGLLQQNLPIATNAPQQTAALFDHRVGCCQKRRRHG